MPILQWPANPAGRQVALQSCAKNIYTPTGLLSSEDLSAFQQLVDCYEKEFQPGGLIENRLVREMIDAEWRLQRVRSYLTSLHESCIQRLATRPTEATAAQAFQALADGPFLPLLLRYEVHFQRQYEKAHRQLQEGRRRERKNRPVAAKPKRRSAPLS